MIACSRVIRREDQGHRREGWKHRDRLPDQHAEEPVSFTVDELRSGMISLRDAVVDRLSDEDQRQVTELIDANEFGVALEWILDSLAERNRPLHRSALELVESLARAMGMYLAVLDRLPP